MLSGCVSTRMYPICFFGERPSDPVVFESELRQLLSQYAVDEESISLFPNQRWATLRAWYFQHEKLKGNWPRYGCIGPNAARSQHVEYKRCLDLLEYLVEDDLLYTGDSDDGGDLAGQVFCDGQP